MHIIVFAHDGIEMTAFWTEGIELVINRASQSAHYTLHRLFMILFNQYLCWVANTAEITSQEYTREVTLKDCLYKGKELCHR